MNVMVLVFFNASWLEDNPDETLNVKRYNHMELVEFYTDRILMVKGDFDEEIPMKYVSHFQVHPQKPKEEEDGS